MSNPSTTVPPANRRLRRREAAEYLGIAPSTLAADICRPRLKIAFIKAGRTVIYEQADLDAWLAAHRVAGEV